MKAYKGFTQDMKCRDFQYEEGKEYEHEGDIKLCNSGFHACKYPLDVLSYYAPCNSAYHEVEVDDDCQKNDEDDSDTKVVSKHIKTGASINIAGLVKAAIEYTAAHVKPEAKADENYGASSATGYCGASSATGYCGASSANNPTAVAVAWGYKSKAKGVKGAHLVFADWEGDENKPYTPEVWTLKDAKMVQVDGETIKADTWYKIENGEILEVKEAERNDN